MDYFLDSYLQLAGGQIYLELAERVDCGVAAGPWVTALNEGNMFRLYL